MSKLIADIVVLGCGAVGSATLYELARNKVKVIGIEQYGVAHDKGSSHGETRAMRQGYYDNPRYIPILKKAYQKWLSFEKEAADKFFEEVGVIKIGVENSIELNNTVTIAKDNGIDIEI